ncbi:hypothetical protein WJX72_000582 [[Myrmecia] bisecta]|uniref:UspA domain-containing protein n=1 Tax=[Myrmecia] bisecta TaxID=41462 RepID=A0AAW1QE23_9CHLO
MAERVNGQTTADRVAEPGNCQTNKKIWLVPVDDSPASENALVWTLENLFHKGDELHLVHVIPQAVPEVFEDFVIFDNDPKQHEKRVNQAKALMNTRYEPHLKDIQGFYDMHIVHFRTDTDSIGAVVGLMANKYDVTAVIMAKHNKGRIQRWFIGSASNACLQKCSKPVMLLHEP